MNGMSGEGGKEKKRRRGGKGLLRSGWLDEAPYQIPRRAGIDGRELCGTKADRQAGRGLESRSSGSAC